MADSRRFDSDPYSTHHFDTDPTLDPSFTYVWRLFFHLFSYWILIFCFSTSIYGSYFLFLRCWYELLTRYRYTIWIRIRQTDTNPSDSVSQCKMSNVAEFYNSNFRDKGSISSTVTLPVFISRKPLSINIVIASAFLTVVGVQCGVPLLLWEREGEVGARDHSPLSEDAVPTRRHPDRLARRCCHHWKIRYFFLVNINKVKRVVSLFPIRSVVWPE